MNFSQRKVKLRSGNSIVNVLSDSALYGESCKTSFETIHYALKSLDFYGISKLSSLYYTVKKLKETLTIWAPYKADVLQAFRDVSTEIQDIAKKDFETEPAYQYAEMANLVKNCILKHAVEVFQGFIVSYTYLPLNAAQNHEKEEILQLKGIALEILHTVCVEFEFLATQCTENEIFLHCLFSYLQYDQTCFPACRLLECLTLSRKISYDLSHIHNLKEIVMGFSDIHLGNFCKILAITLSELDMYENKTSLYAQTKQKKNQNFYVRDVNQDVILQIPNILSKLVDIACAKPYVPWFPSGYMESEQWVRWIEDQEVESAEMAGNPDSFIGGITEWTDSPSQGLTKTSIQMTMELTFRADALCVLGLLLVGRHRKEVQKELAKLKLIPHLSDLFDHFIWRTNIRRVFSRLPGHNNACECSPEVALKIQVLRLIHSFCDHSNYKHVMLSWSEYSEIQAIKDNINIEVLACLDKTQMCVGLKGLLSKIVDVIKKENGASTFRFWLSRAIESYLRGGGTNTDQDFLLRRDLLRYVVQNLITINVRHKEVLQSGFDLLGELVRFNMAAFVDLNAHVCSPERQKKLISLMNSSLVDSNMFLRSLILSYEQFVSSGDEDMKVFAEECCPMLCHIGSLQTRVNYLQRLLNLINVHNLTQENVSCLNTALVILMFGHKRGDLPQYLKHLASNIESCSVATSNSGVYIENLRNLLLFWQDHYLQKDKDCTILENSSRICFQEWKDTVSLLTTEDKNNPSAIAFYTMTTYSSRAS